MDEITLKNYLKDLGALVMEDAFAAKHARDEAKDSQTKDFENGRVMAYYEIISTMQNQATAFGLSYTDVGLEGILPDRDLT